MAPMHHENQLLPQDPWKPERVWLRSIGRPDQPAPWPVSGDVDRRGSDRGVYMIVGDGSVGLSPV